MPSLDAGTYTVTVSLSGFKTAVVKDVVLAIGTPGSIKAVLEVGGIEQTVEVVATTQLINTQTPTIASTLTSEQINKLPVATRILVNAVTFLPASTRPASTATRTSMGCRTRSSRSVWTASTTTRTSTSRPKGCSRWSRHGRTPSRP